MYADSGSAGFQASCCRAEPYKHMVDAGRDELLGMAAQRLAETGAVRLVRVHLAAQIMQ